MSETSVNTVAIVDASAINTAGITPLDYKVSVVLDEIKETTAGGIIVPLSVQEQDKHSAVKGTLVGIGGNAFRDWDGIRPEIGARVLFAKYVGLRYTDDDGNEVLLLNDKDIIALIDDGGQK